MKEFFFLLLISICFYGCNKNNTLKDSKADIIPPALKDNCSKFAQAHNLLYDFKGKMIVFTYEDNQHYLTDSVKYENTVINPLSEKVVEEVYNPYYRIIEDDRLINTNTIDINTTFCIKAIGYTHIGIGDTNYVFLKDVNNYPFR